MPSESLNKYHFYLLVFIFYLPRLYSFDEICIKPVQEYYRRLRSLFSTATTFTAFVQLL